MGARQKLNNAYFNGAVLFAAFIGIAAQSWTVFFVSLVVLILLALNSGDIRPSRRIR